MVTRNKNSSKNLLITEKNQAPEVTKKLKKESSSSDTCESIESESEVESESESEDESSSSESEAPEELPALKKRIIHEKKIPIVNSTKKYVKKEVTKDSTLSKINNKNLLVSENQNSPSAKNETKNKALSQSNSRASSV